jgi:hypothetical protein
VFRRSAIVAIDGFAPDVSPAADYGVYLRLARDGRLRATPKEVVRYRQHGANMSRDPVVMLRATLQVLARERESMPHRYVKAYEDGRRAWCAFYGEQIIHAMRQELRGARRLAVLKAGAVLLVRHCRPELRRHAQRKAGRVFRGLPAAEIEAGRFATASGGPGNARR